MKIAIASSGLGHVARGIETWALDTAVALSQTIDQCDLFPGVPKEEAPVVTAVSAVVSQGREDAADTAATTEERLLRFKISNVTLFCAAPLPHLHVLSSLGEGGTSHASLSSVALAKEEHLTIRVLPCLKRSDRLAKFLTRIMPGFTWRWGWKSGYELEQKSFWKLLWPILRDEGYDILHVQDPLLADLCRRYRRAGKLRTKEILAHGTDESLEFLGKFDYLQELTPHYAARHPKTRPGQIISVMPNFVDTELFVPAGTRKEECRRKLGISPDAFVLLSVGFINRDHKRMDYLVSEFAHWGRDDAVLVIVGASDCVESKALVSESKAKLGDRLIVLTDLSHERMPAIYAVADVFVLCAMNEVFGIAYLEAMACGIPCIGHKTAVTEWVLGVEQAPGLRPQTLDPSNAPVVTGVSPVEATRDKEAADTAASTEERLLRSKVYGLMSEVSYASGGMVIDMSQNGALAAALAALTPEWFALHGRQARERAMRLFSKKIVIGQYVNCYRGLARSNGCASAEVQA